MTTTAPRRPRAVRAPLKYFGGKSYLRTHIWRLAPPHTLRIYGCCGGAAEAWNWPEQGAGEILNDIDPYLTNFYQVLQHPRQHQELIRRLSVTAFSRRDFSNALAACRRPVLGDAVTAAYHYFICIRQSMMGRGDSFAAFSNGRTRNGILEQASAWLGAIEGLAAVHRRLIRMAVENLDVVVLLRRYDKPGVFFYLDPTYHPSTRSSPEVYRHEMTPQQHQKLLLQLTRLRKATFMLSGYACPEYDEVAQANGWHRVTIARPNAASKKATKEQKIEVLYLNYPPPVVP